MFAKSDDNITKVEIWVQYVFAKTLLSVVLYI